MIVTGERFCQIGEALFGPRWKGVLGQMVDRSERSVWRYAAGKRNVPPELKAKLAIICRARGEALIRIADQIEPGHGNHDTKMTLVTEVALDATCSSAR